MSGRSPSMEIGIVAAEPFRRPLTRASSRMVVCVAGLPAEARSKDRRENPQAVFEGAELARAMRAQELRAWHLADAKPGSVCADVDFCFDLEAVGAEVETVNRVAPDGKVAVAEVAVAGAGDDVRQRAEYPVAEAAESASGPRRNHPPSFESPLT